MAEDIGAAVERILKDPAFSNLVRELGGGDGTDLMGRLPEVMKTLGPILGSGGEEADPGETKPDGPKPDPPPGEQSAAPVPVEVIGKKPFSRGNAEKLFLALRPYLGDRRRTMVDRCVSVMQMTELMKAAGIADLGGRGEGAH